MILKKDADLDDDDDGVARDGEVIHVPAYMKDGYWRNAPGFVALNTQQVRDARAAARDARNEYIRALTDAWKTKTPHTDAGQLYNSSPPELLRRHHLEPDDAQQRRDRQWAEYCDRLSNAWRNPSGRTDPGAAPTIEKRRQRYTYEASR
jgi:hypothetical protein